MKTASPGSHGALRIMLRKKGRGKEGPNYLALPPKLIGFANLLLFPALITFNHEKTCGEHSWTSKPSPF